MKRSDDHDPVFDQLLRERLGGETPPDLAARVQSRFEADDGSGATQVSHGLARPTRRPMGHRLLAAALVILGLGVVVATQWAASTAADERDAAPAQQPAQDPEGGDLRTQDPKAQDPKPVVDPRGNNPIVKPGAQDPEGELEFELRVVDRRGGPIQSFELKVLVVKSKSPLTASKTGVARKLQPRDFAGDYTTIEGLPPGEYVVTVAADAHARTISAPFSIVDGDPAPKVTVALNLGGEIRGQVVDADGKPVVGAVVRTEPALPPDLPRNSPFTELVRKLRAVLHTEATVRTDESGAFELKRLTYGSYALRVEHPGFCAGGARDLEVTKKPIETEPIQLVRGAVVFGVAQLDGKPAAGLEITVTVAPEGGVPGASPAWTTTTDDDGAFRFPVRLPPGSYRIFGRTLDIENPFGAILQIRSSTRWFAIDPAADQVIQNVTIERPK